MKIEVIVSPMKNKMTKIYHHVSVVNIDHIIFQKYVNTYFIRNDYIAVGIWKRRKIQIMMEKSVMFCRRRLEIQLNSLPSMHKALGPIFLQYKKKPKRSNEGSPEKAA